MSDDKIIEQYEERAKNAYKEIIPVKIGKGVFGKVQPKEIDMGEPKLKQHISDIKVVVKEHVLTDKKIEKKTDKKRPPELW